MKAVILAGGQGKRLWPKSTSQAPKQYQDFFSGGKSLLELTLERVNFLNKKDIYAVTLKDQKSIFEKKTQQTLTTQTIYEPFSNNTAPSIFSTLVFLLHSGVSENEVIAFLPSDHLIQNGQEFKKCLLLGEEYLKKNESILTLGLRPFIPHTGFGYIQVENSNKSESIFTIKRFTEKPNKQNAEKFYKDPDYYWNLGMFLGTIKVFLQEFEKHYPELFALKNLLEKDFSYTNFHKNLELVYKKHKGTSIDYAIAEKSKRMSLLKASFDWNDLGSWESAYDLKHLVDQENYILGSKKLFLKNAKNNIIYNDTSVPLAVMGVQNLIIAHTPNGLLITTQEHAQAVKEVAAHFEDHLSSEIT